MIGLIARGFGALVTVPDNKAKIGHRHPGRQVRYWDRLFILNYLHYVREFYSLNLFLRLWS